jgi:hypothetical protein
VPGLPTHKASVWQPATATAPAAAKHMLFVNPALPCDIESIILRFAFHKNLIIKLNKTLTMKNLIHSTFLMIFCVLILFTVQGCKPKPIVFYGHTFADKYNLEIPDYFNKENEGKWLTTKDNGVQWIKMFELKKEIGDLEQQMTKFASLSTGKLYDGMELREKDTLNFNGYKCLFCYYKKNNNAKKLDTL